MEEITKPNDIFAAVLQAPDLNVFDLAKSNMSLENTQLQSKDFYKTNDVVKQAFTKEDGNFDELAFNNAYNKAAQTYSELGNDEQLVQALEWDPQDFTAPLEGKHFDVRPTITKDVNPFKNYYSRTGVNSIDVNDFSLRELAQQGKVYDPISKTWSDKSANELSFFNKFFGDTLVYAQYDKDEVEIDQSTGQQIAHKKGDWKFDDDGNLFIEKLAGREMYNKQIVNPMDMLTVDGSAFNNIDFFDSDGKTKSITGTSAKLLVEIAPFLIPGVQTFYGAYKMSMGLAFVLPTFYKAIEGIFLGDNISNGNETPLWKAMNASQGYLAKYNQRSVSDKSQGSLFNYEQLGGIVSDIYSQIYEQRAAAGLSKFFYKSQEAEYLKTLEKTAQEQIKGLSYADAITGIKRSDESYEKIARAAGSKIQELSDVNKKRSRLAMDLNLTYMAMTQSAQVYGDALNGGYDRRTAGAAALMSAAGQFALMRNNPLGDWFLDSTTGYNKESTGMIRAYNKYVSSDENLKKIQEGITKLGSDKKAGKNLIGGAFKTIKDKFTGLMSSANTGPNIIDDIKRNAIIEGIEEVSEQAVMDMSKGVVDFLSYAGLTSKQGSFGGFDVVFSKSGLENYLANFIGGVVGGAMFEAEHSIISPLISGNGIPKATQYSVLDFVSNGKAKEFLEVAKKQSQQFASNTLSPVGVDINGEQIYLGSEKGYTQADFIYKNVEAYVTNLERILNSESINNDNESWVRKAIVDEIKVQDMLKNNTDSFVISDVRELVDRIVTLKSAVETAQAKNEDPAEQMSELLEVKNQLDEIQSGEKADYYYGLSLFSLNKSLHTPFLSLNVEDYTKSKYKSDYSNLSKNEQDRIAAEFSTIMTEDAQFKNRMKAAFDQFMIQNENFSQALMDYGINGYDAVRKASFDALYSQRDVIAQAVATKDIESLKKVWTNLQTINAKLLDKDINNAELNSSIGINFGKFLLDSGIVSIGLSEKEMSDMLGINPADLDSNLQAQAILNRWEKENNPLLNESLATLQEIINDPNDTSILPVEKVILKQTLLTTHADNLETKVSEFYKPEVFAKQDYTALDDNAKADLADTINAMVPTMDTIEADILEMITDNINLANRKGIEEFSQLLATTPSTETEAIEKHNKNLQKIVDRKTLRVDTEKKVLNKPAFINQNLNKFYEPILELITTLNEALGDDTTKETIQLQRDASISDKETAAQLISALSLDSENFSWDNTKGVIEDILFDPLILGDKAYSELLKEVKIKMDSFETALEANLAAEFPGEEIDEKLQENLSFEAFKEILFETMTNDHKTLATNNFNSGTGAALNESGLLMNNVLGKYSVYQDPYDSVRDQYFTPTAQLIVDFGKSVIESGRKLDNEVIEAAKIELSKLNHNASGPQQHHVETLTKELNMIIEYGNIQRNTLLDKLREIQITLYGESKISKSAFDLLKELNKQFAQSSSPSAFKLSSDTRELIDKAFNTLDMVKAIMSAMTFTNTATDPNALISYDTLYGYNVNFNKMYQKNAIAKELGILGSADIVSLEKELELIEGKLQHFQLLADNNMGSTIKEQGKIKKALLDALQKRLSEGTDELSLLRLSYNGRFLLTMDDLSDAAKMDQETSIAYLENKARENFLEMVQESNNMDEVLDKIFEPFLQEKHKINTKYNLLDNKDSNLTETMSELEVKDWYMYLHSILAGSSIDFLNLYKKYLAKEVSLSENFRAPFYSQQFILRQAFGYLNGAMGKKIMSHSISFIQPKIDNNITTKDVNQFNDEFIAAIEKAAGIPISWLYFIRGTSGTGKSDILANFLIWASTDKDVKLLGDKIDILALAPTEKTKVVLENSVRRGIEPGLIKTNTIEAFIESLFPTDTRFVERINAVKESDLERGEIQFSDPTTQNGLDTGIYLAHNTAVFSQKALDELFKNLKSETPKLIIIDEASKINSLQYQILNYLAEYKNYFIVPLGDDLQEGTTIGPASSSMENIYMPSSIKLKSTIRAENIHKNDNNIALEDFTNSVKLNEVYQNRVVPSPVILKHSTKDNQLNGDRFIDKLTIAELQLLDPEQEILFITDDGEISPEVKNLIIAAFGEKGLAKVKSSLPDVQGQEFKQVVILTNLEDANQGDSEALTLASAKKLYTILTRAKVSTLVVGASNRVLSNLKFEVKSFTAPKALDMTEVKSFLDTRYQEIEDLINNLNGSVKNVSSWESVGETQTPIVEPEDEFTNTANDTEVLDIVQTEKQDFLEIENLAQVKPMPEVILEEQKTKEEAKETTEVIAQTSPKKSLDVKVIGYSFYYNLGRDLPDLNDATSIKNWIGLTTDTQTDFAAYINSIQSEFDELDDNLIIKFFNKQLNYYLVKRNELLAKATNAMEALNSNGVIEIKSLGGVSRKIDLSKEAYIKRAQAGEYSQPYGLSVGAEVQSGTQFFVMVDLDGIPITLSTLASQVTATGEKNKLGDVNRLKTIYTKLNSNPSNKIPINLLGHLERLTGVKTVVDPQKQTKISGDRESLENAFKGATVKEYGAFRGPKYNELGEIDPNSETAFIEELEKTLNTYNKTPIAIRNHNAWETWQARPKGVEAYQKYMYRPYVIMSYYQDGTKYDKLMLLYPTSRSPQEYWNELKELDNSTKDSKIKSVERDSLISRYQAWKVLEDFIISEVSSGGTAVYNDITEWLADAFLLVAYQRSDSTNMQKAVSKVQSELSKWDGKESLTEFITQNKTLQKIFKGVDKSFNPLTALYTYQRTNATLTSLDEKFLNYIKTSDFKVYYSTRLGSLGLSTAHGSTHAAFDSKYSSRYFVGYSIQPPDVLVNLDGIYEESTNVKPVELKTPTKPKTQTKTEEAPKPTEKVILNPTFSIAASTQAIGLFKPNSTIIKVDLTSYPKIMSILNNTELTIEDRTKQLNNLKNFINSLVRDELVRTQGFEVGELLDEDPENLFTIQSVSAEILEKVTKFLQTKDNSSGTKIIAIAQTEPETSICKIN